MSIASKVMIEIDEHYTATPNLIFNKHFHIGLVGYCLGNQAPRSEDAGRQ